MNKDLHSSSKPKDDAMTSELVHRFSSKMPKDSDRECHICKGPRAPFKCPFKDATCRACGKRDHIQKSCKTNKHMQQTKESHQPQQTKGTHLVEKSNQEDAEQYYMFKVSDKRNEPIRVTVLTLCNYYVH